MTVLLGALACLALGFVIGFGIGLVRLWREGRLHRLP